MKLKARKVNDCRVICLAGDDKESQRECEGYGAYVDGWCRHCLVVGKGEVECNHSMRLEESEDA